jgi:hypothetical protein
LNQSPKKQASFNSILEDYFSEFRMEIERSENGAFRSNLQSPKRLVKKLLDK